MIIGLASPGVARTMEEGLAKVRGMVAEGAGRGAAVVCFPEAYLPGLRGQDFAVLPYGEREQEQVLRFVGEVAREWGTAVIMGIERLTGAGRQIAAVVFDKEGEMLGWQTKNQIAPSEDEFYVPGTGRRLFEVEGVTFGVVICHEGWRYPETVRWAAVRGAQIVFQPQHTGSDRVGKRPVGFGAADMPYYEKAMMMRSIENTIYFASVNYGLRYQESATCVIRPDGACQAYLPYGEEGVLVTEVDLAEATGLIARRYAPERYEELGLEEKSFPHG
jgi:predicted amidohydrolase